MEFLYHKLENGLEIVVEHQPKAFTTAIGYFVKTGSRDEVAAQAGVSHFLEHMVFKGTPRRSAIQVNQELDDLGSQANAYTAEDRTVYYATVLPDYQEACVDLLTDLMRPNLDSEDFEMERHVILEEIAMYDDQPPYGAFEYAMEMYFGDHPLALRILGTEETVQSLTVDQMKEYHSKRYASDNLVLVACGNVDFQGLIKQVEKLTADWKPSSPQRRLWTPTLSTQSQLIEHPPANQQYVVLVGPGPSRIDPDRYAARIMSTILGDDSGSRLFWDLIDTGRAEAASTWTQSFDDCGILMTYLCCEPQACSENLDIIQAAIRKFRKYGFNDRELDQALNKTVASIVLSAEKPSNRLFTVGSHWISRGSYEDLESQIDHYRQVRHSDVQAAAEKYLIDPTVTLAVGPLEPQAV